jgi:hypothetical protein
MKDRDAIPGALQQASASAWLPVLQRSALSRSGRAIRPTRNNRRNSPARSRRVAGDPLSSAAISSAWVTSIASCSSRLASRSDWWLIIKRYPLGGAGGDLLVDVEIFDTGDGPRPPPHLNHKVSLAYEAWRSAREWAAFADLAARDRWRLHRGYMTGSPYRAPHPAFRLKLAGIYG